MGANNRQTRILIIDDEPPVARAIARALEREGFVVEMYTNALEAIASDVERADLVISDLYMPVIDGWQFAEIVHDIDPRRPVILISGAASLGRECEQEPRALSFLSKPFSSGGIVSTVVAALESATMRKRDTLVDALRPERCES